jgi:molecular chaperone GrpE (heat shock protein)
MNGGITMGNQENVVQMDFEDKSNTDEENLFEIVLNTREQCQMLQQLIDNQIKVKDEMIDKLHKELEYYKNSAADKFAEQLMKAVIKVHKDMNRLVNSDKWDSMTADDLKREYTYARDDVADLLEQQNVDAFHSAPGDTFDASIHQAKIEATSEKALDKTIKSSVSDGYKKGDKVLIPERVILYQYKG